MAVLGQLIERHKASVPAVATRCAKEHAPAFEYGREGGNGGAVGERWRFEYQAQSLESAQVSLIQLEAKDVTSGFRAQRKCEAKSSDAAVSAVGNCRSEVDQRITI